MKKIKKVFLGITALWSGMIAKVYATIEPRINQMVIPIQTAYGVPTPEPKRRIFSIVIIAIIVGVNFILRKKFKEKKNVLNIALIISSVVVTVLIIFLIFN